MSLSASPRPRLGPGWVLALCGGTALAACAGTGLAMGASRTVTVLPLAAAGVAVLARLAVTRFASFVMAVLAVRTALDAAKLGGGQLQIGKEPAESGVPGWLDPGALLGVTFAVAGIAWLVVQGPRDAGPAAAPRARAWWNFTGGLQGGAGAPGWCAGGHRTS
ncbi:hypothetical protein [Actinomadura roseirufa]|uniref:hypothetical protein n=1 Tax=Actinomadura roseirufa TaxID=2094049 RepID=UPI0010415129|nr:hypothetical protein [Actinomadura roseirufa]